MVVNQVHRFDQMVLDLLELSRLAGVDESHQEPVVPAEAVRRIATRYGYGDVPYDACRRSEVRVLLDKRRLERIVVNLLDNAQNHAGDRPASPSRTGTAACASSWRTPGLAYHRASGTTSSSASTGEPKPGVGTGLGLAL